MLVDDRSTGNADEEQRTRLARMLRDPAAYFADARREAHAQAKRLLAAQLASRGIAQTR